MDGTKPRSDEAPQRGASSPLGSLPASPRPGRADIGVDLSSFVASLCVAAAAVHLTLAPGRFDDHAALGAGFVAVGLGQLALAGALLRRATPARWTAVAVGALAIVGGWLVAHLAGVPFGPGAWEREHLHAADVTVLAFEVLIVIGGAIALARPAMVATARRGAHARAVSGLAAVLVLLTTVAVLVAPGALDAPSRRDRHRVDDIGVPAPTTLGPKIAGIEDTPGGTLPLSGPVTTFPAPGTVAPPTATDAPAPVAPTSAPVGSADGGFTALLGGRPDVVDAALDRATRARLAEELAATVALLGRFPTLGAAEAAGYRRAGPFTPGTGTPLAPPRPPGNRDGRMDPDDLADAVLLYDGTTAEARLAGFLYLSIRPQTEGAPEGFAGPNDRWTYVPNVCGVPTADARVVDTPLGIDRTTSAASCAQVGGSLITQAYWTLHVWTVPAYGSGGSVFRDASEAITCPDGTYWMTFEQLGRTDSLCRR